MRLVRLLSRPTVRSAGVLLGVLAVLGVAAGMLVNVIRPPQWQASTDALVRTWAIDSLLISGQATPVTTEDQVDASTVATSQEVLTAAATRLADGRTWTDLEQTVTATPAEASHFVTITATARDAPTAQATAEAVANAFADLARQNLTAAAAGLTATAAGKGDPSVVLRGELLTTSLQPIQVYRTTQPKKLAPNVQTPIALGIVGLAIGGLALIVLFLARPSIGGARDAQRATSLPAVGFRPDDGASVARLIARLSDVRPDGALLVCPVDAASEKAGLQLVEWIRERRPDGQEVTLLPEPTGAVLSAKPRGSRVSALVVVAPHGTGREDLRDAISLLSAWRDVDAVIVTQ